MNRLLATTATTAWKGPIRLLCSPYRRKLKVQYIHDLKQQQQQQPMGGVAIKNEDNTKQHFDAIYAAENPVLYKEHIFDALQYVSDDFNKSEFDRLILPWALEKSKRRHDGNGNAGSGDDSDEPPPATILEFVDLGACFGNTTMATLYGMSCEAIRDNWASVEQCMTIVTGGAAGSSRRRFPARTTAIDISESAMAYGKNVGLFDETIVANVNFMLGETKDRVRAAMATADILIAAGALVYFDPVAIEEMMNAFCNGTESIRKKEEGYVFVNFLHPFGLEKSDVTKRLLLSKLEFVGSRASRHRRLSTLEQKNYAGEEWVLLEIWVLKRRSNY
jgi:hypothetical protein